MNKNRMRVKNKMKVEKNVVSRFVGSKQSKHSKKNSKKGSNPAVRVPNKRNQKSGIYVMCLPVFLPKYETNLTDFSQSS